MGGWGVLLVKMISSCLSCAYSGGGGGVSTMWEQGNKPYYRKRESGKLFLIGLPDIENSFAVSLISQSRLNNPQAAEKECHIKILVNKLWALQLSITDRFCY